MSENEAQAWMLEPREMYAKAFLGFAIQGHHEIAVYDYNKVIEAIMEDGDCSYEEAKDHFGFNTNGEIFDGQPAYLLDAETSELLGLMAVDDEDAEP